MRRVLPLLVALVGMAGAQINPIQSVTASSSNTGFSPAFAADGRLDTRWSAGGLGQWLQFQLTEPRELEGVSLAWYRGEFRKATYAVEVSQDGVTWVRIHTGVSSGTTAGLERTAVPVTLTRFVRVVNGGNTESQTISLNEVQLHLKPPPPVEPPVVTYYVDCENGSDSNIGLGMDRAVKTVARASFLPLKPGERLLLRRNCTFTGPLRARWIGTKEQPITIGSYGEGSLPWVRNGAPGAVSIFGRWLIVENLQVSADPPPSPGTGKCPNTPVGWRAGVAFASGASHNVLQNSVATGLTVGVHTQFGSSHNIIRKNRIVYNTVMSVNDSANPDNDSGAFNVLLNSDYNIVEENYFEGSTACSIDYGVEGASVEIYKASHNIVRNNISINETTLVEMGGTSTMPSRFNQIIGNTYAPLNTNGRGEALVVRGALSKWGDNRGSSFNGNIVWNSNLGVFCGDGCGSDILTMTDNIIVTRAGATKDTLWTDGPINQARNIFFQLDGQYKVTINRMKDRTRLGTSVWGNPNLADPWGRNFTRTINTPIR